MTDKKRKQEVLTLLRCVRTYPDCAIEKIDDANPITDDMIKTAQYIKEESAQLYVEMFKVNNERF